MINKKNSNFIGKCFLVLIILLFILTGIYGNCFAEKQSIKENENLVAIMIGNSADEIKHQKGLSEATLIYEIPVEFPFTRLMALFPHNSAATVGPIRNSRYYFFRICSEWSSIFVHCGGQHLKNGNVVNIDEIFFPSPFWRDNKIGGWINLFTSITKIKEEIEIINCNEITNQSIHNLINYRKQVLENNYKQINKVTIKYHSDYIVSYEYNHINKNYSRYINKTLHIDQENDKKLTATNIIIQYTPIKKIEGDKKGRVNVEVIGEGIAQIFYNGNYHLSRWIKQNRDEQTIFLDRKGLPVIFDSGCTWIHIVSPDTEVWFK